MICGPSPGRSPWWSRTRRGRQGSAGLDPDAAHRGGRSTGRCGGPPTSRTSPLIADERAADRDRGTRDSEPMAPRRRPARARPGRRSRRTLEVADPRAGEVRVRILASGVCHSDLHVRDGDVAATDPDRAWATRAPASSRRSVLASADLDVGQPVVLSWLVPCGDCRSCRAGRPWACPDSPSFRHAMPDGATVFRTAAGDAVLVVLRHRHDGRGRRSFRTRPRSRCPDGVDPGVAALIGCCVSTGVGAVLKTAEVPAGASVAVIGLGGVGLSW